MSAFIVENVHINAIVTHAIVKRVSYFNPLTKGVVEVHGSRSKNKFTANFQGQGKWQFVAEADTPEGALGLLIQDIRSCLQHIEAELQALT